MREALGRPGTVRELFVDPANPRAAAFAAQARAQDVAVYAVGAAEIAQLSDTVTPQGIVAVCDAVDVPLADALRGRPRLIVCCAQVRDPGNAGTVIRCADAFGADAAILSADSVELANPKTVRASVGSVFHLPVATGVSLADVVEAAHAAGMQVLAADGGGDRLDAMAAAGELARPTCWIFGNEAWGLPPEQAALADRVVGVPLWGRAESLNLSTAAAVCLYASASAQRPVAEDIR